MNREQAENSRVKPPCGGDYCPLCGAIEHTCSWEPFYSWLWKCSNCGETYHMKDAQRYKYCPNCGCKVVG